METADTSYRYDAFISYSHRDKKEAAWLQRKLERYRIPRAIRTERGRVAQKLKIFRDETDLEAGGLAESINDKLDKSSKLIVVCSPNTPVSSWVPLEIQHFIDCGRSKDILPVVIDGEWHDDQNNVMPDNLNAVKNNLFVSSYADIQKRTAYLKILSGVLGTDFDALVRRESKRRRTSSIVIAALSLAAVLLGFLYYDYAYMPHTSYFADYVLIDGKPLGIHELRAAQRAVKHHIFAITTTRNTHELRLEHINSQGLPSADTRANHMDAPTLAIYSCNDDWKLDTAEYFDADGKPVQSLSYAPDLSYADLIKNKDDATWLTSAAGNSEYGLPVRTNISRYLLSFDSNGRLTKKMFAVDRLAAIDETGIGGEHYSYDSTGRLTYIQYLGADGDFTANIHGIAGELLTYDDSGNCYRVDYLDLDGAPTSNSMWYASTIESYDANGNATENRFLDADGNPTISAKGYAMETFEYNHKGFLTGNTYFGVDGEPVYGQYGCHKILLEHDDKGRSIGDSYYDTNNHPMLIPAGYASRVHIYDENGKVMEQRYHGADGEPRLNSSGIYKTISTYDESGNITAISNFGTDNELICSTQGYATIKMEYHDLGLQQAHSFFGVKDEPIIGLEGFHRQEFVYDNRNNITEIRLLGILGQPAMSSAGYASRKLKYDNAGNILEDAYFDDYETLTYTSGQVSRATYQYDERGYRTSAEYWKPDGTPVTDLVVSKIEYEYDAAGNKVQELRYSNGEKPNVLSYTYDSVGRLLSDGSATYQYDKWGNIIEKRSKSAASSTLPDRSRGYIREYDAKRNIVKNINDNGSFYVVEFNEKNVAVSTRYYDKSGNLSRQSNSEGVALIKAEYNERNLKTERRFFDENGNPMLSNEGYAYAVMDYDRNGNLTDTSYYDLYGNLVMNTSKGYARLKEVFDDYNRLLDRTYYGAKNEQLVRMAATYDERGNCTSNAMYNRQNKLQADQEHGVAKNVYFYDEYGYVIGQAWYDADDKPMAPFGAYAKYLRTREKNRTVRIEYYGIDGQLTLNQDGYAIETFTYDERGNETGRAFFDTDGHPVLLKWRFSRYEAMYDESGNLAESKFFDTVGREIKQTDGYLIKTMVYIKNIPQKILVFNGNDDSSLMGEIEIKLYTPITPYLEALPAGITPMQGNGGDDTVTVVSEPDDSLAIETRVADAFQVDSGNDGALSETVPSAGPSKPSFSEREYISAVNSFIRAIESFDGTMIMDTMEQTLFSVSAQLGAEQLGATVSESKIYHFYASFYDEELKNLKAEFGDKYGRNSYITYEILSEEYQPTDVITAANQALKDFGIRTLKIDEMVSLNIIFTVSGNISSGSENTGFLSTPLMLLKINGMWGLGTGDNFPKPPRDRFIDFYLGNR
ncbi:MAG: TIR domain-containing protein [Clostridium sp.]|jgi:hypothetical protein|nr:TIR domain-containing protein [Clostridium sp.]